MRTCLFSILCGLMLVAALPAAKTLDMWVIDTEGGKALLILSPSGQSMLVDTGFPGFNGRDTNRILEACQAAGVSKLNFLVSTHYDGDHAANTPSLVAKLPVDTFVDHGPVSPNDPRAQASYKNYDALPKAEALDRGAGRQDPLQGSGCAGADLRHSDDQEAGQGRRSRQYRLRGHTGQDLASS